MSKRRESSLRDGLKQRDAIRTFICIEVPETIKSRIELLQHELRQSEAQVSWTRVSNIHLTIQFLGDIRPAQVEAVREAVERATKGISDFEIEVKGAGCFPSIKNPRVLWVGLNNIPDELRQLQKNVEDELAGEGFEREPKRFSPHLTIARIRSPHGAPSLAEKLIAKGFEPETFRVSEVIVMRSDLKPIGPIYTPQAIIKL